MAQTTEKVAETAGRDVLFSRADKLVAAATTVVSGAVYFYTAQPNVGLLDSCEFITAAQHFGVPHPTGYPLWTLLAWLFQLLPLGNIAWEINLFSGLCGALAVGVTTLLAPAMLRWMMPCWAQDDRPAPPAVVALVAGSYGLLFAFSFSFWTQAVIAEVYALHGQVISFFVVRTPSTASMLRVKRTSACGRLFSGRQKIEEHHIPFCARPTFAFLHESWCSLSDA